jgi:hypothetical protein
MLVRRVLQALCRGKRVAEEDTNNNKNDREKPSLRREANGINQKVTRGSGGPKNDEGKRDLVSFNRIYSQY